MFRPDTFLVFKMLLLFHLNTDSFDIPKESSLGGRAFGLCSAWRFEGHFLFFTNESLVYNGATN